MTEVMAEPVNINVNLPHHLKKELCTSRAAYRQGRKLTSVKVYTINNESQHLLIYNVPAIGIDNELQSLCQRFGDVLFSKQVINAENIEEFTNVYHIHYATLKSSRFAKRNLDNRSFFGAVLHVCYAPELESMEETKLKLITRRKEVSYHLKQLEFPKQFRYEGKSRGKKRKFEENSSKNHIDSQVNYNYNNSLLEIVQPPADEQLPGPSKVNMQEMVPMNMKPYQNLIPTTVSRIIFYNKKKQNDKTENLTDIKK